MQTFTNPVLPGCADPDVIYFEGTYYLYATNTDIKDPSELGFKVDVHKRQLQCQSFFSE